jgi:hypothetical protein
MKRFVTAFALCSSLLVVLAFWLFPAAQAKEDPIITLLNLPAPPPPNPWVRTPSGTRKPSFYDKETQPPDDAPIEDLLDYWSRMSGSYEELGYNPRPSERAVSRILREIEKEPKRISEFLNVLQDDKRGVDMARDVFKQMSAGSSDEERELRRQLKRWLTRNSDEFAEDLAKTAAEAKDVGDYVSNHEELLALAKVDWERAAPIVDRLYGDGTQKVSKVLATWALYKNALQSGGGDVDRYRDELKAVVEDKNAGPGARDLALDALVKEKEWSGRDDWYYSLLEDESLHNLVVDGRSYTGLTTIMYYTSDEGHVSKLVELTNSDNIAVRSAAVKNLLMRLNRMGDFERNKGVRIKIVKAMIPWLRDPKWVKEDPSGRQTIVRSLTIVPIPEAVPALIAALEDSETSNTMTYATNAAWSAANTVANAANAASNTSMATMANTASNRGYTAPSEKYYPLRSEAINALEKHADARAVPALRRVLMEVPEYERAGVVKALLSSNGFTTEEQVAAIEFIARNAGDVVTGPADEPGEYDYSTAKGRARLALHSAIASQRTQVGEDQETTDDADEEFESYGSAPEADETNANTAVTDYEAPPQKPLTGEDVNFMLGTHLLSMEAPSDDLVRSVVARVDAYDKRDPLMAETLRRVLMSWNGAAVNSLLLRDLKAGRVDPDAVVKLLSVRKQLRETQSSEVADARNGGPAAQGIAPCLLEDAAGMDAVLDSGSDGTKAALFACARLIRAHLSVPKAAANLNSTNKVLALAAERYLEVEDSPEARAAVLRLYPNQAKILGAKTSFEAPGVPATPGKFLSDVFASVSPYYAAETYIHQTYLYDGSFTEAEKRLQKEVITDPELVGVYAYDDNFVHIYKDRAVYSYSDDPARYRERVLEQSEWDNLQGYLAHYDVDKLPPFLACTGECDSFELLMLSRQGGRRVFVKSGSSAVPEIFAGLDKIFDDMQRRPAKLKYYAAAVIPGLEVHFADDRLAAQTVWKEGPDVRVLLTDEERSKSIESEISKLQATAEDELGEDVYNSDHYQKFFKLRESRKYDSFGWFRLAGETAAEAAPQPAQAEYIPAKDGFAPPAAWGQWKSKAPAFEIRADESGLYKIAAGRVTRIRQGNYSEPVVTSNGRWVVASKFSEERGYALVRVNLINNREYPVRPENYAATKPIAYIPSVNKVLVTNFGEEDDHGGEYEDSSYKPSAYDSGRGYYFFDPDTGALTLSVGEVRPIAQQTFRGLQPAAAAGEYWAAIPRGTAGTLVGIYSTKTFTFRPILKLPKLIFDSTEMWVDTQAQRVWFTYQGHVLSAPLK